MARNSPGDLQAEYLDPLPFACCLEGARVFAGAGTREIQHALDAGADEFRYRFTVGDETAGFYSIEGSGSVDRPVIELTWIRR